MNAKEWDKIIEIKYSIGIIFSHMEMVKPISQFSTIQMIGLNLIKRDVNLLKSLEQQVHHLIHSRIWKIIMN